MFRVALSHRIAAGPLYKNTKKRYDVDVSPVVELDRLGRVSSYKKSDWIVMSNLAKSLRGYNRG